MSEEIIIDGVNVAECEHHLSTGYCQLQMIFQGMVLKLPFGKHLECNLCDKDCYYKQLQRLKQKNEELKARFNEIYNNAEQLANKYNKYDGKKENELAEIINKTTDERNKYKQENEELKKRCKELDKMTGIFSARLANKYKRALKEIRKWATNHNPCDIEADIINCTKEDCFECLNYDIKKITRIIDEVLND